jgi:hypothetical protein
MILSHNGCRTVLSVFLMAIARAGTVLAGLLGCHGKNAL